MKNKKTSTYLVIVSITTILTLSVWIASDVYRALINNNIKDSLSTQIKPLPPPIQWDLIEKLALRDYEEFVYATSSADFKN